MRTLILILLAFVSLNTSAQVVWFNKTKLKGKIGDQNIVMVLAIPYGGNTACVVVGEFYYVGKNKDYPFDLCSSYNERIESENNGFFLIDEWCKEKGQSVSGTWTSKDGTVTKPVKLKVVKSYR